jgi:hypothetical protein
MIWKITTIDVAFVAAFEDAGEPDQRVIDDYLRKTHKPMHPPKHEGIRRYYYLLADNPRVRLGTLGMSLAEFAGKSAKIIVGTNEIIGEFEGNRAFIGHMGLKLQCEPIAWLRGHADREFATGSLALAEISEQILDLRKIKESQRRTRRRYEWK